MGLKIMMRFSLAVAVVLAAISLSGVAQQDGTLKAKHSASEKEPKKAAPIARMPGAASSSTANAKDLQALEHQTARSSATSQPAGKKSGMASAPKPVKDKPNPPIDFNGKSAGKSASKSPGMTNQGSNPYQGRLKQKGKQQ